MRSFVVVVALLVAGCTEGTDPDATIVSGVVQKRIPITINRRMDILFVIDNSAAMTEHQDALHTNLRRFADILKVQPYGVPDVRIGVVTTDLGGTSCTTNDDAVLRTASGITGNFLIDFVGDDGNRLRNYDGDLGDAIVRLGDVGTTGCTAAQPLAAARRALENPINRNFLRAEAYLAVVVITAHDTPDPAIDDTVRFFKTIHADPSNVIVSAVLPADAPNLTRFLDQFPNRNARTALADADWSPAFALFTQLIKTTLGAPCVEGPLLDVDDMTPGDQFDCAVWYEFPIGGQHVPGCDESLAGPCWKIAADPQICPNTVGVLKIEQPRVELPPMTYLTMECVSR